MALAEAARGALVEAQEINRAALGYVPDHDTFIDGAKRQALSGITAGSTVLFEFHLLVDVIEYVDEQLILHSPVKTERYARSHVWFADGVEFENPEPPAARRAIHRPECQPYARKIERGLSPQAPEGVYEAVAALAKRRYGKRRLCRLLVPIVSPAGPSASGRRRPRPSGWPPGSARAIRASGRTG